MNNFEMEEEKYTGRLLESRPEMVVSSGALGMPSARAPVRMVVTPKMPTAQGTPRNVPWVGQRGKKYQVTLNPPTMKPIIVYRKRTGTEPQRYMEEMEEKYTGPMYHQATSSAGEVPSYSEPSTSAGPPKKKHVANSFVQDPTNISIMSVAKKATAEIVKQEPPKPDVPLTEEERLAKEKHEKELLRFKEIGRRICELDLTDFTSDRLKLKPDRKSCTIATRGEEILGSVRRNLTVIHSKLGEYADGTLFEDVEKLTKAFSYVNPNALSRLNEIVVRKLKERAEAEALEAAAAALEAAATASLARVPTRPVKAVGSSFFTGFPPSHQLVPTEDEPQIKLEEPDDAEFYH